MGNKISIDKHLSSVNDILDVKSSYFKKKIRFDSKIPDNITHHVKVAGSPPISHADMKVLNGGRQRQRHPVQTDLAAEPAQQQ